MTNINLNNITLVCNPFAKIGRASAARYLYRAMRAVYLSPEVCDIDSRLVEGNLKSDLNQEFSKVLCDSPGNGINIYVINVDQVKTTQDRLGELNKNAYNIIYPAWELSKCPPHWENIIKDFDEVWVPSSFVGSAFEEIFSGPIIKVPHPVEFSFNHFLYRDYFNLPDASFLFLFFFDFSSFIERKNPFAVVEAYKLFHHQEPFSDTRLVIKISGANSSEKAKEDYENLISTLHTSGIERDVIIINHYYSENEIRNLIRCCDCFISLHRSEGFGLGLAEAMYLSKPVIATNYSGNSDFMNEKNSYLVDYKMIPVEEGSYPCFDNQVWADPNLSTSVGHMKNIITDSYDKSAIQKEAVFEVRSTLSFLSVGVTVKNRLLKISHRNSNKRK